MIPMVGKYRTAILIYTLRKQISVDLEPEVRAINYKRHERTLRVMKIYLDCGRAFKGVCT